MPAHIDRHDVISGCEVRGEMIEGVRHPPDAVQQDKRWFVLVAPIEIVNAQAVHLYEAVHWLLCKNRKGTQEAQDAQRDIPFDHHLVWVMITLYNHAMITTILPLFFVLLTPPPDTKQLIDNQRVVVSETMQTGTPAPQASKMDRVAIDLTKPGNAVFIPKGTSRAIPGHAIVVELKEVHIPPIENKTGYPLAFPREGVKRLFENDRVIIWDYAWTKGKPTVMHFHDKDVVVVYLADGKLKSTTPDGQSVVNTISFGLTKFNAPNRSHSEEVVEGSARAVMVEFK
jgi:hypothetical protein